MFPGVLVSENGTRAGKTAEKHCSDGQQTFLGRWHRPPWSESMLPEAASPCRGMAGITGDCLGESLTGRGIALTQVADM